MYTITDLQPNQRFSDCFQHPTTGNKRNCTRAAGCSIHRSMLPHRVLTFHSNLHLLAMSLSSWVVSNWTPVPVRVTLSNPVPENSPWADRPDAVVCLYTGCYGCWSHPPLAAKTDNMAFTPSLTVIMKNTVNSHLSTKFKLKALEGFWFEICLPKKKKWFQHDKI